MFGYFFIDSDFWSDISIWLALVFVISEYFVQVLKGLVHSSSHLGACCLFVVIIPRFDQQVLVFLLNTNIFVSVNWKQMFLIELIVKDDFFHLSWSGLVILSVDHFLFLDCGFIVMSDILGWWVILFDGSSKGLIVNSLLLLWCVWWLSIEVGILWHGLNQSKFYKSCWSRVKIYVQIFNFIKHTFSLIKLL